jgi:hypothetical protein
VEERRPEGLHQAVLFLEGVVLLAEGMLRDRRHLLLAGGSPEAKMGITEGRLTRTAWRESP